MKLQRYDAEKVESDVCLSSDVAQLEAKCAELQRLLDSYIEAFDVINDSMTWAHRIIADPDSIAVIDLPTESMVAKNAELLAAAKDMLDWWWDHKRPNECAQHYIDRLRAAIAKAEGEGV